MEYPPDLGFLSRTAMEFVELPPEEDIYRFIGEKLRQLVGDHYIVVSSFDPKTEHILVRAAVGLGGNVKSVLGILGRDPVGMLLPISEEAKLGLSSGSLVQVPDGIYGLALGQVPRPLCAALERLLDVGDIYSMGFARAGDLFGNVVILLHRGARIEDPNTLETLVYQAAVALQRRRAEEALRDSEARFRRLAENAPDLIFRYEFGPDRGFGYVSPAATRMVGYTPEEFYADPDIARRVIHPEDRHLFEAMLQGRIDEPVVWRWQHKDGRIVWTDQVAVPVFGEGGKLAAIEGIVHDITVRKQLEEQLLRVQKLETAGRIAGQVAHDFNNLLAPLAAYPELIKMELPEGHRALQFCDAMLEAAARMAAINEDMMVLGRSGHLDQEAMDLNHLARQAVAQLDSPSQGLRVEMDLASDLMPVTGSPAQLLRAISNLLSNAREAMQELGLLTVKTENVYVDRPFGNYNRVDVGEYVRLSVIDTGCGILPEIRDRVFDAFFTTKSRANRRGCGLGLSIVQAIVDDHQGYLDFESEVGRGTAFSIYLPASHERLREVEAEGARGGGETLLVVDDDRFQREVSRELLGKLGYRVYTVASGEEAAAHLRDHQADLLILDMIMPGGMDGTETYRRVLDIRPNQKAIILSGFAEFQRVREAQALGAGAYLRKPVTLDRLAKAVREELDRGR